MNFTTSLTLLSGCGDCGERLEQVAASPSPVRPNRELASVLRCSHCHHYWVIRVEMVRAPADAEATYRARRSRESGRRSTAPCTGLDTGQSTASSSCDPQEHSLKVTA